MIDSVLDAVTSRFFGLFDYFTDPFWAWLWIGVAVFVVVSAVVYFFGSYFTWLRPIGGVILLVVTMGLYSYRRGEKDARAHDKKRAPTPSPKPPTTAPDRSFPLWPWQ